MTKSNHHPTPKLSPNENKYISISVGNTNLRWALQDIRDESLEAQYHWSTPHIQQQDLDHTLQQKDALCQLLVSHLPEDTRMFIFGAGSKIDGRGSENEEMAISQRDSRGYSVSVYVVSSNPSQTERVEKLFSCIPSTVYVMEPNDFFSVKKGRYEGMGIDRLAALRGAMAKYGPPSLVFDGGTAFTYTAVNEKECIIGGGITPGLQMRLNALSQKCETLPRLHIQKEAFEELEKLRKNPTRKISHFANNTRDAIIHGMMCELHSSIKEIIHVWIDQTKGIGDKSSTMKRKQTSILNNDRYVIFTGGSGEFLEKLVQPRHELVQSSTTSKNYSGELYEYQTEYCIDLIHIGVNWYLKTDSSEGSMSRNGKAKKLHVNSLVVDPVTFLNKRVAGYFAAYPDQLFRATVKSFRSGKEEDPLFHIVYDDGDEEEVYYMDENSVEGRDLKTLLATFEKYGEEEIDPGKDPLSFISRRFAKNFGGGVCFGTVKSYDDEEKFWKVMYDDGDFDENDKEELLDGLKLYKENLIQDPKY